MSSMAKYWATDLQNRVAGECLQLHGGSQLLLYKKKTQRLLRLGFHVGDSDRQVLRQLKGVDHLRWHK